MVQRIERMGLRTLMKCSVGLLAFGLMSNAYGASPSPLISQQMKETNKKENNIITQAVMKDEVKQAAMHGYQQNKAASPHASSNDVMIVDPKVVAKDWKEAFTMLQNRQSKGLVFHLSDGSEVKDITEIDTLPGGYLMIFTIRNLHGMQYKIIKTAEILSLESI